MKQLLGYQAKITIQDVPEPLLGPHDLKIRLKYSAFSSGTETTRISGQRKLSFLSKKSSYTAILAKLRSLQFREIVARYKKFNGYYTTLGYSCYGEIVGVGKEVGEEYKVGDLVVAGGENACHAQFVVVQQGLVTKLTSNEAVYRPQISMAYLMTIPINGISQLLIHEPRNVLIIGGGLIGTVAQLYLGSKSVSSTVYDPNQDCLSAKLAGKDLISTPKELKQSYDAVLITTGALDDFSSFVPYLNRECIINILGETPLSAFDKGQIEELYGQITFCNSFGFGRRDPHFELLDKDPVPRLKTTFTISHNIKESIKFLFETDLTRLINLLNLDSNEIEIDSTSINIISYESYK